MYVRVCMYSTIRPPGLDLPRRIWTLKNRFCNDEDPCAAALHKQNSQPRPNARAEKANPNNVPHMAIVPTYYATVRQRFSMDPFCWRTSNNLARLICGRSIREIDTVDRSSKLFHLPTTLALNNYIFCLVPPSACAICMCAIVWSLVLLWYANATESITWHIYFLNHYVVF